MSVQLRVILDQAVQIVDADQASAAMSLAAGLVQTAPRGCDVVALAPSGAQLKLAGLQETRVLSLGRRELLTAWQLGFAAGAAGGLIHAPSLAAPLVRHDRVHENDQTTVTLWDLQAWDAPELLPKAVVAWHRAMLKRAVRHADAVVVPSHAMAAQLAEMAALGDRIRVIAGAAPTGFHVPVDADARRARLRLPRRYVVLTGDRESLQAGFRAAALADVDAVVMDAADGSEPMLADVAAAAGLGEHRAHIRGALRDDDRAAALGGAAALLATSDATVWPWRLIEAMHLRVPLIAVDSAAHRDVIADGGAVVSASELTEALEDALGSGERRLRVLASDRSRAFSWTSTAERVWSLHAEL